MKKILTKFWGVAITVVLLSSLCIIAAPVIPAAAADALTWNKEAIPTTVNNVLVPSLVINDMAINGDTVYAVGENGTNLNLVYKSTNGGGTWTLNDNTNTQLGITNADMVAVAPDDPNIVVIIDATSVNNTAWATVNGGATWSNLNLTTAIGIVNSVAISPAVFGVHNVAVATSGVAASYVYYFNLGAAAPAWKPMNVAPWANSGTHPATVIPTDAAWYAVAFSPNFASDYIMLAVSYNGSALLLNAASFNSFYWNIDIGYFDNYPAKIVTATATSGSTKASIAMSPDYSGGDDTLRVSFVGLANLTGTDTSNYAGIVRMNDYLGKQIMASPTNINSIDYNGSVLVAGQYDTNAAWYCTDPLDVTPTVLASRSYKRPGIDVTGAPNYEQTGRQVVRRKCRRHGTRPDGRLLEVHR